MRQRLHFVSFCMRQHWCGAIDAYRKTQSGVVDAYRKTQTGAIDTYRETQTGVIDIFSSPSITNISEVKANLKLKKAKIFRAWQGPFKTFILNSKGQAFQFLFNVLNKFINIQIKTGLVLKILMNHDFVLNHLHVLSKSQVISCFAFF